MKIIDGKNATLGRLASYVAKEALNGEEIIIVNCDQVIITGNKKNIEERYKEKRSRVGSGQLGPKVSRPAEMIVKRAIRGMVPHRAARGKEAMQRVRCYVGIPKEHEGKKMITAGKEKTIKFVMVKNIYRT
ncbi:MAG: 50S ribosomal protein L13 [Nanoarchaeota archaeon]|nr:50S ribosomal protein L13 [Nanoarchaeota archaeon]